MLDSAALAQGRLPLAAPQTPARADPSFRGMRIARVELRNFGTYDGPATAFDFGCDGALIVGENGMGESTAFDAIKVAFVLKPALDTAANGKSERSGLRRPSWVRSREVLA